MTRKALGELSVPEQVLRLLGAYTPGTTESPALTFYPFEAGVHYRAQSPGVVGPWRPTPEAALEAFLDTLAGILAARVLRDLEALSGPVREDSAVGAHLHAVLGRVPADNRGQIR